MEATVLVCLCEQPRRIHKILPCKDDEIEVLILGQRTSTLEVLCYFLVPKSDIRLTIVDDGP